MGKKLMVLLTALVSMSALLIAARSWAQDAVTTAADVQDGTIAPTACDTTNLPTGVWTLIKYDNAGEPCATHAAQLAGSCTPNTWNWEVNGHFEFRTAPGYRKVRVRVQVWAGGGGGACYGGTADPIYCDNQDQKGLKQDGVYELDLQNTDLAVPFTSLEYLLAPFFETPEDANYRGIWAFAMPIGRPAICRAVSFHDLGVN